MISDISQQRGIGHLRNYWGGVITANIYQIVCFVYYGNYNYGIVDFGLWTSW